MKKIVLTNGLELEVNENSLNNMELLDALEEMTEGDELSMSKVVKLMLGKENRKKLYDSFLNTGSIDLDRIQTDLLDRYFLTFTDYWENVIAELKRKNAIINRREYLIELTQKFIVLLTEKGITKYNQLLLDYQNLNYSLLESL